MRTLFAKDDEIRYNLGLTEKDWRKVLACFHNEPAFKPDPIADLRFWPAIECFFLQRYGLAASNVPPAVDDGKENWDPPEKHKRRRSHSGAL